MSSAAALSLAASASGVGLSSALSALPAASAALPAAVGVVPPPPPGPAPGPTPEQIAAINAYTGINDGQKTFQEITTIITEYHKHYPIELRPLHLILGLTDADVPEANRISLNTLSYVYLYSQQINLYLGDLEFKYIREQFFNFFAWQPRARRLLQ